MRSFSLEGSFNNSCNCTLSRSLSIRRIVDAYASTTPSKSNVMHARPERTIVRGEKSKRRNQKGIKPFERDKTRVAYKLYCEITEWANGYGSQISDLHLNTEKNRACIAYTGDLVKNSYIVTFSIPRMFCRKDIILRSHLRWCDLFWSHRLISYRTFITKEDITHLKNLKLPDSK